MIAIPTDKDIFFHMASSNLHFYEEKKDVKNMVQLFTPYHRLQLFTPTLFNFSLTKLKTHGQNFFIPHILFKK